MMRSLYSGISGLNAFQNKMDIIGNNIANVNTIGFKGSRVTFAETMSQTLSSIKAPSETSGGINAMQIGLGIKTMAIDTNFNQGSLESTGISTDLAIQGDGFFIVNNGGKNQYTRAGSFGFDADGNMIMSGNGARVMGYMQNANGGLNRSALQDIQIPIGGSTPAMATTSVDMIGNLDVNLTEANASLLSAGLTGVTSVNGVAENGVGGTHLIEIRGNNATQSQGVGDTQGLNLNDKLSDHGIATVDGFSIVVDGDVTVELSGLTTDSTISDLLEAINRQVSGVTAELDGNNAIQLTRDFHGNGANYNIQLDDGGAANGIAVSLFDAGGAGIFDVNNGTTSTLAATDNFTPNGADSAEQSVLNITYDSRTGLATGVAGLGGGGVTIQGPNGLAEGDLEVVTEDTSHSTSIFVYDSLGNTHSLDITFTRTGDQNVWNWEADIPEPGNILSGGSGTIQFSADGALQNFVYGDGAAEMRLDTGNGAEQMNVALNPGTFGEFNGLTLSASNTNALAADQDGYGVGTLQSLFVDTNGEIVGNYSNGVSDVLAQVLVATFSNNQGLVREGENLYTATPNSGTARIGDITDAGGNIASGNVEMSNVDLAKEFTEMIVTQRAYQANARVITTSDQLLQELNMLKR